MPRTLRKKISVIIPAHNEEDAIQFVLADLPMPLLHEVLVVNNASTDRTAERAAEFHPKVRVIDEPQAGYGRACLTGIDNLSSQTDIVVFIDGDYSDHGEQLPRVVSPILKGKADIVIGSRKRGRCERGSLTPQQIFGNWLATSLIFLIWDKKWTDLGPFRSIDRDALERIQMRDENYGWTVEMQIKAVQHRLKMKEVPVDYRCRIGTSKISGTIKGTLSAGYKILFTIFRYALFP